MVRKIGGFFPGCRMADSGSETVASFLGGNNQHPIGSISAINSSGGCSLKHVNICNIVGIEVAKCSGRNDRTIDNNQCFVITRNGPQATQNNLLVTINAAILLVNL